MPVWVWCMCLYVCLSCVGGWKSYLGFLYNLRRQTLISHCHGVWEIMTTNRGLWVNLHLICVPICVLSSCVSGFVSFFCLSTSDWVCVFLDVLVFVWVLALSWANCVCLLCMAVWVCWCLSWCSVNFCMCVSGFDKVIVYGSVCVCVA